MIIQIVYNSGSGIDENVTQFHEESKPEEGVKGIEVTYEDGSTAFYEGGIVTDAWQDEETHKDFK